jgi:GrpB-like predicted nucleotidyltransferase (UPF0157 family)
MESNKLTNILGLADGKVHLTPRSPEWSRLFSVERSRIESALKKNILDVQHIGSTAVPNLAAKPVLDIGIAVYNFEEAAICIPPLEGLGYSYRGEYGIPRRHYFVKGTPRTHQIHIFEITSDDWNRHIAFRDYLISNAEARAKYELLKYELASRCQTRAEYQDGKKALIQELQALALTASPAPSPTTPNSPSPGHNPA